MKVGKSRISEPYRTWYKAYIEVDSLRFLPERKMNTYEYLRMPTIKELKNFFDTGDPFLEKFPGNSLEQRLVWSNEKHKTEALVLNLENGNVYTLHCTEKAGVMYVYGIIQTKTN
jgi:hypothetical protein